LILLIIKSHPASISSSSIQSKENNLDSELYINNSKDLKFENNADDSILTSDDNKMKRSRSITSFSIENSRRKKSHSSITENAVLIIADRMIFLRISIKELRL
jgi:hypothetical protein